MGKLVRSLIIAVIYIVSMYLVLGIDSPIKLMLGCVLTCGFAAFTSLVWSD